MFKRYVCKLQSFVNQPRVQQISSCAVSIFEAAKPFVEQPSLWNAMHTTAGIFRAIVNTTSSYSASYFQMLGWVAPFSDDLAPVIIKVLSKHKSLSFKTTDNSSSIQFADLFAIQAGWPFDSETNETGNVYVQKEHVDDFRKIIKMLLWEEFGNKPIVLTKHIKAFDENENGNGDLNFSADTDIAPLASKKSVEYSTYLKKFIDAGINRAVMLYGPPGTGKSTMARSIISRLEMNSIRIKIEDLTNLNTVSLSQIIDLFKPDAIILDDFDRNAGHVYLFELLEYLQKNVKLVIATANNRDNIDDAFLRPGRFDELVHVNKMDEDVVKNILGKYSKETFDSVKHWPIAFINEYIKRRTFMNEKEAFDSMTELGKRVDRMLRKSHYSEDQSWSDVNEIDEEDNA